MTAENQSLPERMVRAIEGLMKSVSDYKSLHASDIFRNVGRHPSIFSARQELSVVYKELLEDLENKDISNIESRAGRVRGHFINHTRAIKEFDVRFFETYREMSGGQGDVFDIFYAVCNQMIADLRGEATIFVPDARIIVL